MSGLSKQLEDIGATFPLVMEEGAEPGVAGGVQVPSRAGGLRSGHPRGGWTRLSFGMARSSCGASPASQPLGLSSFVASVVRSRESWVQPGLPASAQPSRLPCKREEACP